MSDGIIEACLGRGTDRVDTAVAPFGGTASRWERMDCALSRATLRRLDALTEASPLLLVSTLAASVGICLRSYSGEDAARVCIGALVTPGEDGVDRPLAVTDRVDGRDRAADLLARIRNALAAGLGKPSPDAATGADAGVDEPFARVMVGVHAPCERHRSTGAIIAVTLRRTAGDAALIADFRVDRLERSGVWQFLGHLIAVLDAVTRDPRQRIDDITLLGDAEEALIARWSTGRRTHGAGRAVHVRAASQAARRAHATAIEDENRALTFERVQQQAAAIASRLRAAGARRGSVVGVCLPRGVDLPVTLLGVLSSGAAYVPLDPVDPDERLRFMLAEARVPIVVSTRSELSRLRGLAGAIALDVEQIAEPDSSPPPPAFHPAAEDLAYVMFTSGSTGRPKGVMNTHGGLENRLCWMQRRYQLISRDAVLHKTPATFDVSLWELLWSLMVGARLVVARPGGHRDPAYLADTIRRHRVTVVHFVPSMLRIFLDEPASAACTSLRQIVCSGESLSWELQRECRARLPHAALSNLYGPTEAAIDVSWHECRGGAERRPVPIGRPIWNTALPILDRRGRRVPVGGRGELFIGGANLALGYVGRPELTAERFVPSPLGDGAGARLYRTGDLARLGQDGRLTFLGRRDDQVKIRGHRVELEEIDRVLERHDRVVQAATVVRQHAARGAELVAFVQPRADATLDAADLTAFAAARLPASMIPARVVGIGALPLTASGKVDRRALGLRELPDEGQDAAPAYVGPVEEILADVWRSVLGSSVGRLESFFARGGHSLAAARVVAHIRQKLGVDLPVQAVFDAPTIRDLAVVVGTARRAGERTAIGPRARPRADGDAPLSFAQRRLWFLERAAGSGAAYHLPGCFRVRGTLSVDAVERSFQAVATRHAILRTVFVESDGVPAQRVLPDEAAPLPVIDLEAVDPDRRVDEATRLCREEARRPFALDRRPAWRHALFRLTAVDHVLLVCVHHLLADAWSLELWWQELTTHYGAAVARTTAAMADLPIQYGDYAAWQHDASAGLQDDLEWWRGQLRGLERIRLPLDRPWPLVRSGAGDVVSIPIASELAGRLDGIARDEHATLFTAALAAFAGVLSRYGGSRDIGVGVAVANRTWPDVEPLIGLFVNTMVVRTRVRDIESFRQFLRRMRGVVLESFDRAHVPFERVVDALAVDRDVSRNPLFDVMFAVRRTPRRSPAATPALGLEPMPVAAGGAKFDLEVHLVEHAGGEWTLDAEYSTDVFDGGTVGRLLRSYRTLMSAAVERPDCAVGDLPVMDEDERQEVVRAGAGPLVERPETTLDRLIWSRIAGSPSSIAVSFEQTAITYRELGDRAERMAASLLSSGVRCEDRVGVCLDRSADVPVALLAVLRAGACYVPLDPDAPEARLQQIAVESGMRSVLTTSRRLDLLRSLPGRIGRLPIDSMFLRGSAPVRSRPHPGSLAYVIFTSGSTGVPKGAANEHRAVVNRIQWMQERYDLRSGDAVLHKTPLGFDVSAWEIVWPLVAGARLVVAPPGAHRDPVMLTELIRAERITVVHFVPSVLDAWLQARGPARCPSLRLVIASGEGLPAATVDEFRAQSRAELHNLYGPTEAAIDVTCWPCRERPHTVVAPIGRPLANVGVWLLDRGLRLQPTGALGEICIGGAAPARGYVARPDLTAERFVPDSISGSHGARLYLTGDIGRTAADGTIEFLGRADAQVKVHGVRVELPEIESVLRRHPSVEQVAVVLTNVRGHEQLVAYVVPRGLVDADELRRHTAAALPAVMVPAWFVCLGELPLSPNGKLDRRSLPPPMPDALPTGRAPRTETERGLAAAWQEVLGAPAVTIDDNFFALGGDSIQALRAIAKAAERGLTFSVQDLFRHPTIADLATVTVGAEAHDADDPPAPGPIDLLPAQRWFFEQDLQRPEIFNQAVTVECRERLSVTMLHDALGALVRRHDALRTAFVQTPDGPSANIHAVALEIPLVTADTSELDPRTADLAAARLHADLQASFQLDRPPLWRAALLRTATHDRLTWIGHHTIVDALSLGILFDDLSRAYGALESGQPPRLAPSRTSLQAWAAAARRHVDAIEAGEALRAWEAAGFERAERLPFDLEAGPNLATSARTLRIHLSDDEAEALAAPSRHGGPEPRHLLLAALGCAIARTCGIRFLAIDVERHGRDALDHADASRLVGWFTTIAPVLIDGADEHAALATAGALLGRSRDAAELFMIRHLHADPAVRARAGGVARCDVLFNDLGRWGRAVEDDRFAASLQPCGVPRFEGDARAYLLEITSVTLDRHVIVDLTYSVNRHRVETVDAIASAFRRSLEAISRRGVPAAERFPLARMSDAALARVVDRHPSIEDLYPLTPAQEGMLFHSLGEPSSGSYCGMVATMWTGADQRALGAAVEHVIRRHPALRSTLVWEDVERPHQLVSREAAGCEELDYRSRFEAAGSEGLTALLDEMRHGDMATRRPMRWILARLDARRVCLAWIHHHALVDGWSVASIGREVLASYEALARGRAPALPPVRPFRDYVAWLQQRDPNAGGAFWRRRLADCEPTLLTGGRPPARESAEFSEVSLALDAETTHAITELARGEGITLSAVVSAAWAVVLATRSKAERVLFGQTISGRPADLEGAADMIGMFINTVPCPMAVPRGAGVREWLRQTFAEQGERTAYEHVSLAHIARWLRRPSAALFDSIVVVENYPALVGVAAQLEGAAVAPVSVRTPNHYPFTLRVEPAVPLRLRALYDRRWFSGGDAGRILTVARAALERFVSAPRGRVEEVMDHVSRSTPGGPGAPAGHTSPFASVRPQPVDVSRPITAERQLFATSAFPLLVEPAVADVDPAVWIAAERERVDRLLLEHGALLFRGFPVRALDDFARFAKAFSEELYEEYGDLPRKPMTSGVYESTPYPADRWILFHNESSHLASWPSRIWFFCVEPATDGGETPIADCRRMCRLLDASIVERIRSVGLQYVRNFVPGLDVSWQRFFNTTDRGVVAQRCRETGIELEWRDDGGLRTSRRCRGILSHPRTGDEVFFNQVQLHHPSCLDPAVRESIASVYGRDRFPRDVRFGDGAEIHDDTMARIGAAYQEASVAFRWERGDVLLLDNMRMAHARRPFVGRRACAVALADMVDDAAVPA